MFASFDNAESSGGASITSFFWFVLGVRCASSKNTIFASSPLAPCTVITRTESFSRSISRLISPDARSNQATKSRKLRGAPFSKSSACRNNSSIASDDASPSLAKKRFRPEGAPVSRTCEKNAYGPCTRAMLRAVLISSAAFSQCGRSC